MSYLLFSLASELFLLIRFFFFYGMSPRTPQELGGTHALGTKTQCPFLEVAYTV